MHVSGIQRERYFVRTSSLLDTRAVNVSTMSRQQPMMPHALRRSVFVFILLKCLSTSIPSASAFLGTPTATTTTKPITHLHTLAQSSRRRGCFPQRTPPGRGAVHSRRGKGEDGFDLARAKLREAVDTREAPAAEVSGALALLAEGGGPTTTIGAEDIEGRWELVFSTQLERGYMPIRELVGFYPSRQEATIDASAGPLPIGGMRGQCWWKGGPENELDFNTGRIKLGPLSINKGGDQVKTYKFFLQQGEILAAKSSAGGFALLSRVVEDK